MMLSPKVDVCQTDDGWEITAELPGVDEKDIDLRLDGDMLTISGEKRDERKDDKNRFVERSYGSLHPLDPAALHAGRRTRSRPTATRAF